jgi:hypothetical protein
MKELARGLIVLHPKQSFVDWVNSWSTDEELSLEEAGKDADAILIPEFESEEEVMDYVRLHVDEVFGHVLANWCCDRSIWPGRLDYATFSGWFDVSWHSMVFDMGDGDQTKPGLN